MMKERTWSLAYGDLYKLSAEGGSPVWIWERPPWEEEGRELEEEDETELDRECGWWRGRKSRGMEVVDITCIWVKESVYADQP